VYEYENVFTARTLFSFYCETDDNEEKKVEQIFWSHISSITKRRKVMRRQWKAPQSFYCVNPPQLLVEVLPWDGI